MPDAPDGLPLPNFVDWPIFPFEGELRVRAQADLLPEDGPRAGEPGGGPCESCLAGDEEYAWVDERWRVRPPTQRQGVPVLLFLETRDHVDMDTMTPELVAELGQLIVRLDRAIQAVDGIGRVHVNRWGDGASHFHMWFYGRPRGTQQMFGFCLPMWAMTLPPTDEQVWQRNIAVVARELASGGGRAIAT
jgi:hypothetical protein